MAVLAQGIPCLQMLAQSLGHVPYMYTPWKPCQLLHTVEHASVGFSRHSCKLEGCLEPNSDEKLLFQERILES